MTTPILFLKAATPAGSHWITINGGDGKGQHVLIKEKAGGGAEIVGGAGGALNGKELPPKGQAKPDAHKEEKSSGGESSHKGWHAGAPDLKHGDHVAFENGEHVGHGQVHAVGRDGAMVRDSKGGTHHLPHDRITHKWSGGEDGQAKPESGPQNDSQVQSEQQVKDPNARPEGASGKTVKPQSVRKMKSGAWGIESAITDASGEKVGFTDTEETPDAVTMRTIKVDDEATGKGHGLGAYVDTIDYALSQGKTFQSDKEVSATARKVYDRLKKMGYSVEQSQNVTTDDYGRLHSTDKGPVFTISGKAMSKAIIFLRSAIT